MSSDASQSRPGMHQPPMPPKKKISPGTIIGIVLAVVLVGLVAFFVWKVFVPGPLAPTMPEKLLKRIPDPTGIEKLVTQMPSEAGNAADDYWQIVTAYASDPEPFDTFIDLPKEKLTAATPMPHQPFAALEAGALKRDCRIYFVKTPQTFDLFSHPTWAKALLTISPEMVYRAATLYDVRNDPAGERALWEKHLLYGWHLCQERVRPGLFFEGLQIQLDALTNLAGLYQAAGQGELVKAAKEYETGLLTLKLQTEQKLRIIKVMNANIANLIWVIERDEDRMWKVEALLTLSFRRYTVSNDDISQYQYNVELERADKLLDRMANDPDPYVAAAARAARAVTREQVGNIDPRY